ncbi:MAG: hypothetical protein ABTD50_14630 [Polyangiaceae bacterium]
MSSVRPFAVWLLGCGLSCGCSTPSLHDDSVATVVVGTGATVSCAPGRAGCPCSSEGAVAQCGSVITKEADWVSCAQGQSTCTDGRWTPCSGNTVVTKSVRPAILDARGARTLGAAVPCDDPCDPYCAALFLEGPGDVDASGVMISDGGVTIEPYCLGLQCQVPSCDGSAATTLIGKVFDPAQVNAVANAYVYIPVDPTGALLPMEAGAACQPCGGGLSFEAVAAVQTAPDGTFALENVPSTDTAPYGPIPLVVQKGKWRREAWLNDVPACVTTSVDASNSHLPANRFDGAGDAGDIPKMAIDLGAADALECMMYKAGIDPAEFQAPTANGASRIDTYATDDDIDAGLNLEVPSAGATAPGPPLSLSAMAEDAGALFSYDAVLLPCDGERAPEIDGLGLSNMAAYANAGGRLITTHLGVSWLTAPVGDTGDPNPLSGAATWNPGAATFRGAQMGVVDSVLPNGLRSAVGSDLDPWLLNVGAASTGNPWQISVLNPGADILAVSAFATEWLHGASGAGSPIALGFDTPLPGVDAGTSPGPCGRVLYADYHGESRNWGGRCTADVMTPQESVLEYMLFDLTDCVLPDSQDAPAPNLIAPPPAAAFDVLGYRQISFTEDFVSACPPSTRVVWRALAWNAIVPPTAAIVFSAQTADLTADGGLPDFIGVQSVALATDTTSTSPPGSEALLDINSVDGGAPVGAFANAVPPVESKGALRLTVTLTPTTDGFLPPTLLNWQVTSDCLPSE